MPSVLIDSHLALLNKWTPRETVDYVAGRLVEAEEITGELLLRALDDVGPEKVDELVEKARVHEWGIQISDVRVAATSTIGLARRRALPALARDVERTLGRPPRKTHASNSYSPCSIRCRPWIPKNSGCRALRNRRRL